MGRPTTNISLRLRRLRQAVERAKNLPPSGWVLSSKPMAELVGMRWAAMRDWCDGIEGFEESGTFIRGGNGVEWQFNAMAALMWLVAHFESEKSGQEAESDKLAKAIGIEMPGSEAPSLAETKDLINLTLTVTAAAERQNMFVPAEDVARFIEGYNEAVVAGILGVRTKVDPNGNLPPDLRKRNDEALRHVAANVHSLASGYIEEHRREGIQSGGTG